MADDDSPVRNIPAAILIALVLQLGATIWWAARMDTRLDTNDRIVPALLVRIERAEATNQKLLVDIAQVQAELRLLRQSAP